MSRAQGDTVDEKMAPFEKRLNKVEQQQKNQKVLAARGKSSLENNQRGEE